jgi:hypothetical protein
MMVYYASHTKANYLIKILPNDLKGLDLSERQYEGLVIRMKQIISVPEISLWQLKAQNEMWDRLIFLKLVKI